MKKSGKVVVLVCILVGVVIAGCNKTSERRDGGTNEGVVLHRYKLSAGRLEYCIKSDELWASYLVGVASNTIQVGNSEQVIRQMNTLKAAVQAVQLDGNYAGCEEPVLLGRDEIIEKLRGLADQLRVDLNITRGVFVENKDGFITAIVMLLEQHDTEEGVRKGGSKINK